MIVSSPVPNKRSIRIIDVEQDTFDITQISLTCPYTFKRLEEPVIVNNCASKHPFKTVSKKVIQEFIERRKNESVTSNHKGLRCPHCGDVDIIRQPLIPQPVIQELLEKTGNDVSYVYQRDGNYYLTERDAISRFRPLNVVSRFNPPPAMYIQKPFAVPQVQVYVPPARQVTQVPKKKVGNISAMREPRESRLNGPKRQKKNEQGEWVITQDYDPRELAKIAVDEKNLNTLLERYQKLHERNQKLTPAQEKLDEFWDSVACKFRQEFGRLAPHRRR